MISGAMWMGVRIFSSPILPEFRDVPVRKHKRRRWVRKGNYHLRIQKKWNTRFGMTQERMFVYTPIAIYCHPNNYKRILEAIEKQGSIEL